MKETAPAKIDTSWAVRVALHGGGHTIPLHLLLIAPKAAFHPAEAYSSHAGGYVYMLQRREKPPHRSPNTFWGMIRGLGCNIEQVGSLPKMRALLRAHASQHGLYPNEA